jgi:hypothetical protein
MSGGIRSRPANDGATGTGAARTIHICNILSLATEDDALIMAAPAMAEMAEMAALA